jgi:Integrase core domain
MTGDRPAKKQFKPYPLGYFPIYIAEVCTEEGKLYMFVAIDRVSKFAYAELHTKSHKAIAAEFLRHLITAVPYKIHTVLTDNGIQFTNRTRDQYAFAHLFDRVCQPTFRIALFDARYVGMPLEGLDTRLTCRGECDARPPSVP